MLTGFLVAMLLIYGLAALFSIVWLRNPTAQPPPEVRTRRHLLIALAIELTFACWAAWLLLH